MKTIPYFSIETIEARKASIEVLQTLRDHLCLVRLLHPTKVSIRIMGNKLHSVIMIKPNLISMIPTNTYLHRVLEGKFQWEEIDHIK